MGPARFTNPVTSEAALRQLVGTPSQVVRYKQLSSLDQQCQEFIRLSPFLLMATTNSFGYCDVSPRGDAPGFVQILDEVTLVIPERSGNRRVDTLGNIIQVGSIGMLFLIPGEKEALRVNGRACVIRDKDILARSTVQGQQPLLGIGVEVEEAFIHCTKAIERSRLWEQARWQEMAVSPSVGQMLQKQTCISDITTQKINAYLEEDYKYLY
ncbi:MSMEG_1061 family FMN-dependent PPOX-type flavoprotein [Dictyobacter aurantiacus]|uniref:Phosphohydrolase n=1 Tax=Dictyobacter aurantiacus TaxID=1936993 RepID=A0A401ZIZ6_9CHLR|nr:MSMEG_1061 family FMN-dependent PPOX-type flavoprotein [Dictyobacter aurantiacus]GCE06825.1 phosphohydrolase [Dictyobacter aurantiacus]